MLIHEGACFRESLAILRNAVVAGELDVGHALEHQEVGIPPDWSSFWCVRTVLLSIRSRVPVARMAGGKPWKSP
jgi:hypothetical protein